MRLLVCGPRNLTEEEHGATMREALYSFLSSAAPYEPGFVFGHGAAPGADFLWEDALVDCYTAHPGLWMPIHREPAHWRTEGDGAGPLRNARMLKRLQPTYWLAAHWDLEPSTPGTADMVKKLRAAHVPGKVVLVPLPAKMPKPRKAR